MKTWIASVLLLLAVAGCDVEANRGGRAASSSTAVSDRGDGANAEHPTDLKVFDAGTVAANYAANEVRTDDAIKGKLFAVRGLVEKVGNDLTGGAYVALHVDGVTCVQCFFDEADRGALAELTPGQPITIAGTGGGTSFNPLVLDCWIYDENAGRKKFAALEAQQAMRLAEKKQQADAERKAAIDEAKWHTWTHADGKHQVEAKFLSMTYGSVKLQKRDGSTVTIKKEDLSPADQKWIDHQGWNAATK